MGGGGSPPGVNLPARRPSYFFREDVALREIAGDEYGEARMWLFLDVYLLYIVFFLSCWLKFICAELSMKFSVCLRTGRRGEKEDELRPGSPGEASR